MNKFKNGNIYIYDGIAHDDPVFLLQEGIFGFCNCGCLGDIVRGKS